MIEIEATETNETLTLELIDCELETIMDPEEFYNEVFVNLNDGYQANALRDDYSYLFVDTGTNIFDGAFACNCFVRNAIIDLRNTGRAVLHAVDPEDIEEIREDWFN